MSSPTESTGGKAAMTTDAKRYWLTPPDLYTALDAEFHFTHDPCPVTPEGLRDKDGLGDWGAVNWVNPPFRSKDGSPTAFARKAIEEAKKGKTSVLALPTQSYVNLLLEAGAELRSAGRVRWLEVDTKEPMPGPSPITLFILKPKALESTAEAMQKERAALSTKLGEALEGLTVASTVQYAKDGPMEVEYVDFYGAKKLIKQVKAALDSQSTEAAP